MKNKRKSKTANLLMSFREVWRYNRLLFFVLAAGIIVNSLMPFPNIIMAGLVIDSIASGNDFLLVVFYVAMLFGLNYVLGTLQTLLNKMREYQIVKFTNKLNNDIDDKCMNIDFEQFNDSSFQDRISLIQQSVHGNKCEKFAFEFFIPTDL